MKSSHAATKVFTPNKRGKTPRNIPISLTTLTDDLSQSSMSEQNERKSPQEIRDLNPRQRNNLMNSIIKKKKAGVGCKSTHKDSLVKAACIEAAVQATKAMDFSPTQIVEDRVWEKERSAREAEVLREAAAKAAKLEVERIEKESYYSYDEDFEESYIYQRKLENHDIKLFVVQLSIMLFLSIFIVCSPFVRLNDFVYILMEVFTELGFGDVFQTHIVPPLEIFFFHVEKFLSLTELGIVLMILLLSCGYLLIMCMMRSNVFERNRHLQSLRITERLELIPIDIDLRCDSQKNSPMKHEPKLAKVLFTGNVEKKKTFVKKIVSLELFAQLTDPRICCTLEPRELVRERVKSCAIKFSSINLDRFHRGEDIVANTIIMTMWWFDITVAQRGLDRLVF